MAGSAPDDYGSKRVKVLLTGPCGRVGYTTFARLIEAGYEVRGFDTRDAFASHPPGFNERILERWRADGHTFEWCWGDVRDPESVQRAVAEDIDVVIHHAAMTLPTQCEEAWQDCWEINYYGTRNILDAIRAAENPPHLIFSSSVAVYGPPRPNLAPFRETDPLTATCTYAATKVAAELEIRRSGVPFTIMRIASAIDFRAPHLALMLTPEMLIRVAKENRLKAPDSPAHFVSTDDVNTAYLNAIGNSAAIGHSFNLAGPPDCRTTFREVQDELAVVLGGSVSNDDEWGTGPYPQHHYETAHAQAVLDYVHTPRTGLIENLRDAVAGIADYSLPYGS